MTDVIERVARAIFDASPPELGRSSLSSAPALQQRIVRVQARAAIGAMREPSAAMIAAGQDLLVRQVNVDEVAIWRCMADAALNGDPGVPHCANDDQQPERDFRRDDGVVALSPPAWATLALALAAVLILILLYGLRVA